MSAYGSIFQKRTRPVETADFRGLPHFRALYPALSSALDHEYIVDAWNRLIPSLYPADLYDIFSKAFGEALQFDLWFCPPSDPDKTQDFEIKIRSLENKYEGSIKFRYGRKDPAGSGFKVEDTTQSNGYGKAYFKAINELSLAMGNKALPFIAAGDNGGYTWAKAGAYINAGMMYEEELLGLKRTIKGRLCALRPYVDSEAFHKAYGLARIKTKRDISTLAQINEPLPDFFRVDDFSEIGKIRERIQVYYTRNPADRSASFVAQREVARLERAFMIAASQEKPMTLGRALLVKTGWIGLVDFSDKKQMEKIGDYIGGWNTIDPVSGRQRKTPAVTPAFHQS